jgi:hypothetical protein
VSLPHATLLRRARKLLLLSKKDTKFICDLAAAFVPTNVILGVNSMPCTAMSEKTMNEDQTIRAALDRHWAASDANDFEAEHEIYHDDAVLEYPQSGRSAQYSSVSFCAAEQEALYGAARTRCCRTLGY